MRNTIIGFCNRLQAIPYFASLGNEIVVRIDDEKCSDLFVKLQICHGPGSYTNSAGVASSQESQHAGSVHFLVPTLSLGVGKRLNHAPSEGPLELAVGVEPELLEPGRLRPLRRAPKQLQKIVPRRAELALVRQCDLVNV